VSYLFPHGGLYHLWRKRCGGVGDLMRLVNLKQQRVPNVGLALAKHALVLKPFRQSQLLGFLLGGTVPEAVLDLVEYCQPRGVLRRGEDDPRARRVKLGGLNLFPNARKVSSRVGKKIARRRRAKRQAGNKLQRFGGGHGKELGGRFRFGHF
jgi:hypothetical protein